MSIPLTMRLIAVVAAELLPEEFGESVGLAVVQRRRDRTPPGRVAASRAESTRRQHIVNGC